MSFQQVNTSSSLSSALGGFLYTTGTSHARRQGQYSSYDPVPLAPPAYAVRTSSSRSSSDRQRPPLQFTISNSSGSSDMPEHPAASLPSPEITESSFSGQGMRPQVPDDNFSAYARTDGTRSRGTSTEAYSKNVVANSHSKEAISLPVSQDTVHESSLEFIFYTGPETGSESAPPESPRRSISVKDRTKKSISRSGGSRKQRIHQESKAGRSSHKPGPDRRPPPGANASKSRRRVELPRRSVAPVRKPDGTHEVQFTTNLSGNCTKHARNPRFRGELMDFEDVRAR